MAPILADIRITRATEISTVANIKLIGTAEAFRIANNAMKIENNKVIIKFFCIESP
jgi:hypothetical protein